jgi:outer membrane protein assembly factor BamB
MDGKVEFASLHTNPFLYMFNPNGSLSWTYAIAGATGYGMYSSPATDVDGTMYMATLDNNFRAMTSNGVLLWSYMTGPTIGYVSSIIPSPELVSGNRFYCGAQDGNIYAMGLNGTLLWSYQAADLVRSTAAIADDGSLYVGATDNTLYSLASSGGLLWSYRTDNDNRASPAINSVGQILVGSYDSRLYCFNSNRTLAWSYNAADSIKTSPGIGNSGRIYIGNYVSDFFALEPAGTLAWSYKLGTVGEIYASPAIDSAENVLISCNDNILYSLNSNGTLKWSYRAGASVESSPTIASDGTVYVGANDCMLYALYQATPTPIGAPLRYDTATTDQTGQAEDRVVSTMTDFDGNDHPLLLADGTSAGFKLVAETSISGAALLLNGITSTSTSMPMTVGTMWCVLATGGASGINITLPSAMYAGKIVFIKKVDSGAGAVSVVRAGSNTIEGATSVSLATQYKSILLVSDGVNTWYKISSL